MNTRLIMISSSVVMATAGITLSFMPDELSNYAGVTAGPLTTILLQITGSLYLGFAMLNWMAKGNVIGGIYSRPIAMGNFMHFVVGGLALIKFYSAHTDMKLVLIPTLIYIVFAVLFSLVAFNNPEKVKQA